MDRKDKIYVAGHRGMVGSAIMDLLEKRGFKNTVVRTSQELDLRDGKAVECFFTEEKPDIVVLAAAKVGGIKVNSEKPAEFLYDNLAIQNNVIHQSYLHGVKKLCFLGSSCIYPREAPQPIKEEYLMTGPLEPTNEGYALAKLAGYKMAYFYAKQYGMNTISIMPCNLYGANDHFDLEKSHVMSALVKRFVDAVEEGKTEITLWGSGIARREFLNVEDAAEAVLFALENINTPEIINVGTGKDISIKELAEKIASTVGFAGEIKWDTSRPDGMLRKCLDVSRMTALGFVPIISLNEGIERLIEEYKRRW